MRELQTPQTVLCREWNLHSAPHFPNAAHIETPLLAEAVDRSSTKPMASYWHFCPKISSVPKEEHEEHNDPKPALLHPGKSTTYSPDELLPARVYLDKNTLHMWQTADHTLHPGSAGSFLQSFATPCRAA